MTANLDMTNQAAKVKAPTLLCWGKYDFTCPLFAGHNYANAMPTADMHVSKYGSHNWLIQRPEEFASAINEFVAANSDKIE